MESVIDFVRGFFTSGAGDAYRLLVGVDTDEPSSGLSRRDKGRTTAAEGVQHDAVFRTARAHQHIEQGEGLLGGIADPFRGHVIDGGNLNHIGRFLHLPFHAITGGGNERGIEKVRFTLRIKKNVIMLAGKATRR